MSTTAEVKKKPQKGKPVVLPDPKKPSAWMLVALLQTLVWLFGVPILCRKYVWDNVFGALMASHPTYGNEIAEVVFVTVIPPVFFLSYTLVMIPIYAGNYPFFEQYRIQQHVCWPWFDPRPKVREDFWKLSLQSLKFTAINVFLLVPILVVAKTYADRELFRKDKTFFFRTDDEHWPSMGKNIQDIFSLVLIHEFGFYLSHKMMHSYPFLYQYHKVHHEYKINTTLAAQHNHPVDYVLSISGPAVLALVLVSTSHSISQFQYLLWTLWANLDDHVGYAFPWSPVRWFPGSAATDEHEFHHSKNMGCYASKLACFNSMFGGYEHYDAYCANADRGGVYDNKKDGANSYKIKVVREKQQ